MTDADTGADADEAADTSDEEGGHSHYVDPSMDGSCTACVGARRIYCLDGGREDEEGNTIGDRYDADGKYIDDSALLSDYSLGSCQPKWSYCTWNLYKYRGALMNYRECQYTPV